MHTLGPVPEHLQPRIAAVWEELVDFDFHCRPNCEVKEDSLELAEKWANETLHLAGPQRITSPLFWSHQAEATNCGLGVLAALHYATRMTPELGKARRLAPA